MLGMVGCACIPSTWETEAGGSTDLEQAELHSKALSQKTKKKKKRGRKLNSKEKISAFLVVWRIVSPC
jgi:hypothetical protein